MKYSLIHNNKEDALNSLLNIYFNILNIFIDKLNKFNYSYNIQVAY